MEESAPCPVAHGKANCKKRGERETKIVAPEVRRVDVRVIPNQHDEAEKCSNGEVDDRPEPHPVDRGQGRDEKEALENIKEAITAWMWAEDQKAMQSMPPQKTPLVVAV